MEGPDPGASGRGHWWGLLSSPLVIAGRAMIFLLITMLLSV